jgi:hypothetical protein
MRKQYYELAKEYLLFIKNKKKKIIYIQKKNKI